jgi:hypothetical protein
MLNDEAEGGQVSDERAAGASHGQLTAKAVETLSQFTLLLFVFGASQTRIRCAFYSGMDLTFLTSCTNPLDIGTSQCFSSKLKVCSNLSKRNVQLNPSYTKHSHSDPAQHL